MTNTLRRTVWITALLGILSLLVAGCSTFENMVAGPTITPAPPSGTPVNPPQAVADVTLTMHTGETKSLADFRGNYVLLYFGYTHCPDICPLTMAEFLQIERALEAPVKEQVRFIFISVDGYRDTPDVLANYVTAFNPAFIGLTGPEDAIQQVGEPFSLYYEYEHNPDTSAEYLVAHTITSFLLDREGQLIRIYPYQTPSETIAVDLTALVNAG